MLDAVLQDDATHVVAGLPDVEGSVSLVRALAELRISGVASMGLALPEPGDLLGIGGPAELSSAALEAGEAVVAGPGGVVPRRGGGGGGGAGDAPPPRQAAPRGGAAPGR